ncbi:hypothetical protein GCM10020229_48300 [Kitasatospora albolonga]
MALRLQRQERLRAADAPTCWFIVDEFVLRRQIGGPAVMREQLEFLIDAKAELDVEIQVLPREIGAHQGMGGVLTILAFSESPGVVYVENPIDGTILASPDFFRKAVRLYDHLRTVALTVPQSRERIASILKETKA